MLGSLSASEGKSLVRSADMFYPYFLKKTEERKKEKKERKRVTKRESERERARVSESKSETEWDMRLKICSFFS